MLTAAASEAAGVSQMAGERTEITNPTEAKAPQLLPLRRARLWLKSFRRAMLFPKQPQADARGQQRQKLREMGTYLQEIRHERGLSLEAVASSTLIPLRLLRAIEVGDLDALPEPIYIRGFLKQFADALALDGSDFARTFPTASEIKAAQVRHRVLYLPSFQVRPLHLYFFYLLLVFLSVQGISYVLKQQMREISAPPTPLPLPSLTAPPPQPAQKLVQPPPAGEPVPEKPVNN
jgi:cytoskeletal protein RodZ